MTKPHSRTNPEFLKQGTNPRKSTPPKAQNKAQAPVSGPIAPRIALACDWLTTPGGAEKVLLELHHMYPEVPIYTSQYRPKKITWFSDATVRTGWLNLFPASLRKFLGPLRVLYFSHLDLSHYDVVISVTGAEAKAIKTKPKTTPSSNYSTDNEKSQDNQPYSNESATSPQDGQSHSAVHLCYCHVPTQYYWQMYNEYLENPGFGFLNPLVRLGLKLLIKPLRKADFRAASQPDQFIAISSYAADQIKTFYHRDAKIIAPPVEISRFSATNPPDIHDSGPSFPQNVHNKSRTSPQEIHNKNTVSPQKPPTFPQLFHPKSTKNPTLFHEKRTITHKRSTKTTNLSTNNPQSRDSFSTTFAQKTKSFPQFFHKKVRNVHPSTSDSLPKIPDFPYFIISCRQVTWKRVDLAIKGCILAQKPLLVIGDGPEHRRLEQLAKTLEAKASEAKNSKVKTTESKEPESQKAKNLIRFIPWLDAENLARYLKSATAYIFPSLEPFGIAAVEALAAGCPVIAYQAGGSCDIVQPGKNGLFFSEQTPESLAAALRSFNPADYDRKEVARTALRFSADRFRQGITELIDQNMNHNSSQEQNYSNKTRKPSEKPIKSTKKGTKS